MRDLTAKSFSPRVLERRDYDHSSVSVAEKHKFEFESSRVRSGVGSTALRITANSPPLFLLPSKKLLVAAVILVC
jgi:hypothetical protein